MRRVTVSLYGKDMMHHSFETDATSLFDACENAIQEMCRYWWWNEEALLEIRSGPDRWQVSQTKVRDARKPKRT
jgi:hypothetical protein